MSASPRVAAVVLAAGASRRFGAHKLLLPLGGTPVVRGVVGRVVAAASIGDVVVVLGREAERVGAALDGLAVRAVVNPRHLEGMSTSLRVGVEALPDETDAALVVLADQPAIETAVIEALVAAWRRTGKPIVAPAYRGERGHPVLFARTLFGELCAIDGDRGARDVLARHRDALHIVAVDRPFLVDIDTPDDYARLVGEPA